mgnify:CR=1 FL=1
MFAQLVVLFGTALFFASYQCRDNRQLFRVQFLSYLCYTAHLFLLGAATGAVSYLINTFRSFCLSSRYDFLRSRAMDAQLFTVGVCPARNEKGYIAYGHSMVCSPWGEVLAEADYAPEMRLVQMDFAKLQDARNQLPLFPARRDDLYELKWLK